LLGLWVLGAPPDLQWSKRGQWKKGGRRPVHREGEQFREKKKGPTGSGEIRLKNFNEVW